MTDSFQDDSDATEITKIAKTIIAEEIIRGHNITQMVESIPTELFLPPTWSAEIFPTSTQLPASSSYLERHDRVKFQQSYVIAAAIVKYDTALQALEKEVDREVEPILHAALVEALEGVGKVYPLHHEAAKTLTDREDNCCTPSVDNFHPWMRPLVGGWRTLIHGWRSQSASSSKAKELQELRKKAEEDKAKLERPEPFYRAILYSQTMNTAAVVVTVTPDDTNPIANDGSHSEVFETTPSIEPVPSRKEISASFFPSTGYAGFL
ncbi:MAG: hypothetical protein L6R40_000798 [Gallowayella cf. fulva]|nr:MAG: hypothetical protein L6R40_000798 [Xanthomendoza cf. fulva]